MKKLANRYQFERTYSNINGILTYKDSNLYAYHNNRYYKTKMIEDDLPEYYCNVWRCYQYYDIISSKGIIDMKYTWVKENHFMKDSVLHISYSGKIEPYYEKYKFANKEIESCFISYKNEDDIIYDYDIFKFLSYAHKYSNYDLSEIKDEFINQCKWLSENEPLEVPDLNGFKDYGEWFDNIIEKEGKYES